jgi:hypothetical protein
MGETGVLTLIIRRVRARQTNRRRRLARARALDVDLRTLHVELRALCVARAVQRDQLAAEEILSWRDAGRDRDGLHALGGDEAVDAPFTRAVETVFETGGGTS